MKNQTIDKRDPKSSIPNKYIRPFAYQQWKIIEGIAENREKELKLNRHISRVSSFVYSFSESFLGIFGLLTIVVLVFLAFTIPFTTQDPTITNASNKFQNMFSNNHILGTNSVGQDVWARLWHGLRFSFLLAFSATLIDVCIGVFLGILMGYYRKFDIVFQKIIKILENIPTIIIMILITLVFKPSFWILVLAMTFTGWIGMANQVRGQVIRAKNFLWVTASRILGTKQRKIIYNFIPIIIPILITQLVFSIPGAIFAEASLAVIGLSIPGAATLGNMIANGATIITIYSRFVLIPSFMLVLVTTSIQFIGTAIQDAIRRQR